MHEVFLAAGGRKLVFPDSGPGPITAVGTNDIAYFGEVSNLEVLSAEEFASQIPEFAGAGVVNDDYPWLKFRYYGKYLFIKKFPIFKKTSGNFVTNWGRLYNAGLIYGVDGPGPYNYSTNIHQLRFVKKGQYNFKVRTITGDTTETATGFSSSNTGQKDTGIRKSMFTELIYRVCNEIVPGYDEPKFAKNLYNLLMTNEHEICREISKGAGTSGIALLRGNAYTSNPGITTYTFTSAFASLDQIDRWRPVLELIPTDELFSLRDSGVTIDGVMRGAPSGIEASAEFPSDGTNIQRLSSVNIQSVNVSYLGDIDGEVENLGTDNVTRIKDIKILSVNPYYVSDVSLTYTA
jgi:hypothetical protein